MNEDQRLEEYNNIPVYYCRHCLSLKIMTLDGEQDFCDTCGGMDIGETSFDEWDKLYQDKYKHKFLENGRKRSYYRWADPQE